MQRSCVACTQVDDHPRHVMVLPDGTVATWHMDCHTGCGDCSSALDGANGATGDELRAHITGGA